MRIAAIDVGTNTIRLLVADWVGGKRFTTVVRQELITRLGGDFVDGTISEIAMERTIQGLIDFRNSIAELQKRAIGSDSFKKPGERPG